MNVFTSHLSSSSANLYTVNDGASRLLLECGATIKQIRKALGFGLSSVAGCLLTHSHLDHARAAREVMAAGVDLFCSVETAEALSLDGHRLNIVTPFKPFTIGAWRVMAFPTRHDCDGSMGYLLRSRDIELLFVTDSFYIPFRFLGLTHIAVECNYSIKTLAPDLEPSVKYRLFKSHFSLENVIKFLEATDLNLVREVWLLHLSDGNSDEQMFVDEVRRWTGKPVFVAKKG